MRYAAQWTWGTSKRRIETRSRTHSTVQAQSPGSNPTIGDTPPAVGRKLHGFCIGVRGSEMTAGGSKKQKQTRPLGCALHGPVRHTPEHRDGQVDVPTITHLTCTTPDTASCRQPHKPQWDGRRTQRCTAESTGPRRCDPCSR